MLRARGSKADEIDDCIRLERRDARTERPHGLLGSPIDVNALYCIPCWMPHIRLALSTTGGNYVVAGTDKAGDEKSADVAGGTDDDKSH